jgi:hypothetical protein
MLRVREPEPPPRAMHLRRERGSLTRWLIAGSDGAALRTLGLVL